MIVENSQVQDETVSSFLQLHTSIHKHETLLLPPPFPAEYWYYPSPNI